MNWGLKMQSWRRILYFLLLNVLISALTTWAVVTILMRNQPTGPVQPVVAPASQSGGDSSETLMAQPAGSGDQSADLVVVSEWLAIESILGAGELETERVVIQHVGEKEVSLAGWQLQDEDGNAYSFPALTMFQGGAVTVYSRVGTSTVVELYWGQDEPVWGSGEQAFLIDSDGQVQAVYNVP